MRINVLLSLFQRCLKRWIGNEMPRRKGTLPRVDENS
jgi:hypothetical protein